MRTAVLGATGLVGRTMLRLLEDCPWLTGEPLALASPRSAGAILPFADGSLVCREVDRDAFAGLDLALFSAGGEASRQWAPVAAAAGAWVVDNSSAFRMDADVPLVVPEINGGLVQACGAGGGIIANPNCSTIQIAMAVAPLAAVFGLARGPRHHPAGGLGRGAEGRRRTGPPGGRATRAGPAGVFPRPIAGNAIPAIGAAQPDGSFEEEAKVERELRKILGRARTWPSPAPPPGCRS